MYDKFSPQKYANILNVLGSSTNCVSHSIIVHTMSLISVGMNTGNYSTSNVT